MLVDYRITGRSASGIAADIERAIGAGELQPGQSLPPLRTLAADLGVNPNTVAAAYRLLRDRGVIETAGRRGSRVRDRPASTSRERMRVDVPAGVRDVSTGNPDPALLPSLGAALTAAGRLAETPVLYGAPAVDERLRVRARQALDDDGVPDGPVALCSGSLDAIERALAVHLRPGDTIAVEDPGWGNLLDLVPAMGLRAVPVRLDDLGPLPADVHGALKAGARALVVTDRAQNPTGAALNEERADELRTVLRSHPTVLLIEDDHGHGIVEQRVHPLAGSTAHWAFIRSTAKAYGPDLRLAVLTGDQMTVDRVLGRHRLGPGWVSHLLQAAVVQVWESGAVRLDEVAASYTRRRGALVRALAARGVTAHGRSGINVWVPVPDETAAVTRLLQRGWAAAAGAPFRLSSPPALRVTVSDVRPEEIETLADALSAAVRPPSARRYT